jgi:hypothetical protein
MDARRRGNVFWTVILPGVEFDRAVSVRDHARAEALAVRACGGVYVRVRACPNGLRLEQARVAGWGAVEWIPERVAGPWAGPN